MKQVRAFEFSMFGTTLLWTSQGALLRQGKLDEKEVFFFFFEAWQGHFLLLPDFDRPCRLSVLQEQDAALNLWMLLQGCMGSKFSFHYLSWYQQFSTLKSVQRPYFLRISCAQN